jgi:hypothetical protein
MADYPRYRLTDEESRALIAKLEQRDPEPFRQLLAESIGCDATPEALHAFANKAPDRHMQRVMMLAKLAGYSEKVEVEATGLIGLLNRYKNMSDAELEIEYQARTAPKPAKVLDLPRQLVSGASRAEGA